MPIIASNFTANSLQGTVQVVGGQANIGLPLSAFAFEGAKTFVVKLRKEGFSGPVIATSNIITVSDTTTIVSLTANISTVTEGNAILYTLTTTNVVNGTNVFFSTNSVVTANVNGNDFVSGNTGVITINNNVGTLTLVANADLSLFDETGERFTLQIRTNNTAGNVVVTSSNVLVSDTSNQYNVLSFVENSSTVAEGGTLTLIANVVNIPVGTTLYYTTSGNATSATFTGGNTGSIVMNSISNTITLLPTAVPYSTTQNFTVQLRRDSLTGTVLATSNTIIAVDSALAYMTATGGTIVDSGGYRIHTFTSSNILNVTNLGLGIIDVLSIGGGGSGASATEENTGGAGGGAGGYVYMPAVTAITGNITVTIGAGGTGSLGRQNPNNGSNTSVTGPNFSNIISVGGGSGGNQYFGQAGGQSRTTGNPGGSGGGGVAGAGQGYGYPSPTQQGYPGGSTSSGGRFAGGGGAGQAGGNGAPATGSGKGGDGLQSDISGTPTYYAGGGGGGAAGSPAGYYGVGAPGVGGGGAGGAPIDNLAGAPMNGATNRGGGGGGGQAQGPEVIAGSGGSGIVIIRYPYVASPTVSNVLTTSNLFVVGSNITFTVNAQNANLLTLYYSTDGNVDSSYFIGGNTGSFVANASGGIVTLLGNTNATVPVGQTRNFRLQIRQDSTTGFISGLSANVALGASADYYIQATGGNVSIANGYKYHAFTTSGNLIVTSVATVAPANNSMDYLVIGAGGGGAAGNGVSYSGGGGGGGNGNTGSITATVNNFGILVGGGGAGGTGYPAGDSANGTSSSILSGGTIASADAGFRGQYCVSHNNGDFSIRGYGGASGNTLSTFGLSDLGNGAGSSGGGMGTSGFAYNDATYPGQGGRGKYFANFDRYGTNVTNSISNVSGKGYFGGGAGSTGWPALYGAKIGGYGGGANGQDNNVGLSGLQNTGGGGSGGSGGGGNYAGGSGASGIIIIRYPYS